MPPESCNGGGTVLAHALTTNQLRVLRVLAEAKGPLTRPAINEICAGAGTCPGWLVSSLGPMNEVTKARHVAKGNTKPNLLSLGYVRMIHVDVEGKVERLLEITPTGRAALHNHERLLRG